MNANATGGDGPPDSVYYVGGAGRLLWLALGQMALTIVTIGAGRFWMLTRMRRYYWSAIRIDGEPLEYTGRPLEKLIGFLIAVVILAAVLTVLNLTLAFAGLSFFDGHILAQTASLIILIPFGFWAQYCARRYILSRTRWRGVRFGVDKGAVGYALRAVGWLFAVALSLGLLVPLMQMNLARYTTDRTYFGDLKFEQRGSAWGLMQRWLLVWVPFAAMIAGGAAMPVQIKSSGVDFGGDGEMPAEIANILGPWAAVFTILYIYLSYAALRYNVASFRYLTSNKVLAGKTWFEARLSTWTVIGIFLLGGLAMGIMLSGGLLIAFEVFAGGFQFLGGNMNPASLGFATVSAAAGVIAFYLAFIAAHFALVHVFFTQPLLRATCRTMTIHGLAAAARAQQRDRAEARDAGGFADALGADVGGAF